MGACECKATARSVVKCDEHLMAEMRSLGFDPVRCGYRETHRQRQRIIIVRCPGCKEEREVVPSNARLGLGIRCLKCAGAERRGKRGRDPVKTCACGAQYSTHSISCDECILNGLRRLRHDALSIERRGGIVYAVCRCSTCGEEKPTRVDDLKRPRVHRPWRCKSCWDRRNLTTSGASALL